MKFTYIATCSTCSLCSNPSLRVAYIDEVEERGKEKVKKVYYSVLVKAVNDLDQVSSILPLLALDFRHR